MGETTGISWTDSTWSPVRGCTRISPGCENCYAERLAGRFSGAGKPFEGFVRIGKQGPRWTGKVTLIPEQLAVPLRWRKPRRVFVNSMSDTFHESLSNEEIAAVFGVMAACPQHTFQVLTKRPARMREWFGWVDVDALHVCLRAMDRASDDARRRTVMRTSAITSEWPLPNVWLGVSVEDQQRADERIPELLVTPAAVRWLSVEPMLGPVDLWAYVDGNIRNESVKALRSPPMPGVDWVVCGAESGPGSRPTDLQWARDLRDECRRVGVAYFVKQLVVEGNLRKEMVDFPEDLRIQEFPR